MLVRLVLYYHTLWKCKFIGWDKIKVSLNSNNKNSSLNNTLLYASNLPLTKPSNSAPLKLLLPQPWHNEEPNEKRSDQHGPCFPQCTMMCLACSESMAFISLFMISTMILAASKRTTPVSWADLPVTTKNAGRMDGQARKSPSLFACTGANDIMQECTINAVGCANC